MKKSILIIILLFNGCGFKVVNQSDMSNYYIAEIRTKGDKKINFDLKNKLNWRSGNIEKERIILTIETSKNKKVKEKNNKNEITKYILSVSLTIQIENQIQNIKSVNMKEEQDFRVGSLYSDTIKNEKEAIKQLTDKLFQNIAKEISSINK